jgi:two-component system, NarL family, nitrate/nitrite response regulator NarL
VVQSYITVVVVDDHPFYRDGVSRGLSMSGRIRVVGEADDGRTGLEMIREREPQVAVVDMQMPDLTGLDVVRAVVRDGLPTRVLLLSAFTDAAIIYESLQEGAAGYLPKDTSRAEIVTAVDRVAKGHVVVPPTLTEALVGQIRSRSTSDEPVLSPRERQVLLAFAEGTSIPQLAAQLYLAPSTVKTHALRLYQKLGVSDRGAAVAEALRRGLIE